MQTTNFEFFTPHLLVGNSIMNTEISVFVGRFFMGVFLVKLQKNGGCGFDRGGFIS